MPRPQKSGLAYFPLDVDFLQNIKVRKIIRAQGPVTISILISLLGNIYKDHGYYFRWDNDICFLVSEEVGTSEATVSEVVNKAVQVGFFDKNIFDKHKILTSSGIQKRFLEATTKRVNNSLKKELDLVTSAETHISDTESTQSKVKKSKENILRANALFEKLWQLYPVKKGKGSVSDTQKLKLLKIGDEEMIRALNRYLEYVKNDGFVKHKNGATFFNSGYVDYLDANYTQEDNTAYKGVDWLE